MKSGLGWQGLPQHLEVRLVKVKRRRKRKGKRKRKRKGKGKGKLEGKLEGKGNVMQGDASQVPRFQ
ncbi:hypothetical protein [Pseudomonas putida]|uniref:hypothetical protein n=1 Tax=Pseudomonas putida TaxID=303 RepID=UPI0037362748